MAKLSPTEAAEKWARNTKGATQDMRRGIERVTEAPGMKAAEKVNKMRAGVLAALDDGTWEENVAAVSLQDWKKDMIDKGVGRVAAGVDGAQGKQSDFYSQLFDHQEGIARELEGMPDLTLEDGIDRAVHQMRRMSEFKKRA